MSEKQWVQHISGQGEKWEVCEAGVDMQRWQTAYQNGRLTMYLPKSEYRLCDPPEVWRDVTEECCEVVTSFLHPKDLVPVISCKGEHLNQGYRLRKVQLRELIKDSFSHQQWAFIVEKKVSE